MLMNPASSGRASGMTRSASHSVCSRASATLWTVAWGMKMNLPPRSLVAVASAMGVGVPKTEAISDCTSASRPNSAACDGSDANAITLPPFS